MSSVGSSVVSNIGSSVRGGIGSNLGNLSIIGSSVRSIGNSRECFIWSSIWNNMGIV